MQIVNTDVVVVGGGAGLRAAIAVAERDAALRVCRHYGVALAATLIAAVLVLLVG